VIPQKTKNRTTIQNSDTTPGNIYKGMCAGYDRATYTPMFITALFTIAKL
jgi:hypothetical protein